ncbi:phage holin family protein [Funiculus sociatus GB2-A5]|uniref:Phage holin family protein n=1 Tax=Funiculus sociatus GB2-A5 TaxID=2933946 RepID=A0ABV0JTQ9_9CYAN|nr:MULTISPECIES: phage holin family protein [unclassified Trichocoleus]MBD1904966.1 phage holin family protein [Trichocoleus sp. FACHB-832]MBD1931277.1 phage holin family protein [Trichocoleus sp. FACHB-69]MBD2064741.1 phage holin family protein [Trichocoleus sp. FACHB-6]
MPYFLVTWLITAIALVITTYIVPGFAVKTFVDALIAAIVLGLANAIVKPLLVLLTLPLTLVTLGLFLFVVNALTLWLVAYLTPGFVITNLLSALVGSIVLTVVASGLNFLFNRAAQ